MLQLPETGTQETTRAVSSMDLENASKWFPAPDWFVKSGTALMLAIYPMFAFPGNHRGEITSISLARVAVGAAIWELENVANAECLSALGGVYAAVMLADGVLAQFTRE